MTINTTTLSQTTYNLGTYSNVLPTETIEKIVQQAATNFVDKAAYPELAKMEQAVVGFLLKLANGPLDAHGLATTGSSEAIMLALAWHARNFITSHPKQTYRQLNFVVSQAHHKSFEKFAVLFGVELRAIPLAADLRVDLSALEQAVDAQTFCIVGIAGSTELGMIDDIQAIDAVAGRRNVAVHIDAAAGGYIAPFLDTAWDFALPSVQTINISAHKYGLCLPGIGFLLVRHASVIPDDYSGEIAYLSGGSSIDHALSCTRNGAFVMQAYHNASTLGRTGYSEVARHNLANARYLAESLQKLPGTVDVIQGDMPVVNISAPLIEELSGHLCHRGWIQSPHHVRRLGRKYIRIVVRRHITREVIDQLLEDTHRFYAR